MLDFFRRKRKPVKQPREEEGAVVASHKKPTIYSSDLTLPSNEALFEYYDKNDDPTVERIHVHLVAIYNVEQLASEIAKYLKNSINDRGDSKENSNSSPKT
jgi:hypothetical protein